MGNNPVELAKKSDVTNHINNKNNPHQVKANQVIIGDAVSTELELEVGSNVDDALVTLNNTFEMINDSINGSGQTITAWKVYKDEEQHLFLDDVYNGFPIQGGQSTIEFYRTATYNRSTKEYEISDYAGSITFKTGEIDNEEGTRQLLEYVNCYAILDQRSWEIFQDKTSITWPDYLVKVTEDCTFRIGYSNVIQMHIRGLVYVSHKFTYLNSVTDEDPSKYPNYAYSGDYYYVRQDGLSLSISKTMYSTLRTTSTNSAEIICEFSPKILILQDSTGNNVFFWIYGSSYLSYNTRQAASVSYDNDTNTINLTNMTSSLTNKTFNLVVIG